MSRRLNKRQQRELEELEALGGADTPDNDLHESEPEVIKPAGGFAALMGSADDEAASESDDDKPKGAKSKKSKKKKKKNTTALAEVPDAPKQASTSASKAVSTATPKNEKKALKKAKAKEKKAADDELEQALKELSVKYPATQRLNQKTSSGQTFSDLISVSAQFLDPEAEMKKFFGAKVVQANKASSSGSGSPARRQGAAVRSTLTRPQQGWWPAKQREGLSIRSLTDDEMEVKLKGHGWEPVHDEKWWTVEYTRRYKSLTKVFMRTVASGDPQGFWDLLSKSPYHADTLLQVSEVYRHREEHAQAVDFVDRAMFSYERAFVGAFNFLNGSNRLDFDRVENRPFFLAVHRQVADLQRRGCVRTAFEFAKLLYSLDPWSDPHGALLHLDHLAVRAGVHQWVIDIHELFASRRASATSKPDARIDPSLLPGFTYTKALALRSLGQMEASTEALKTALQDFPSVLPLLADKLDVSLPATIRSHPDFKIETDANSLSSAEGALHLLSHLYAQRSQLVWKDHAAWLADIAVRTFDKLPSRLAITPRRSGFLKLYEHSGPRYAAYRYLMVLETEHRSLFPFIPRAIQQTRSLACDPLPPPTSLSSYSDESFFEGVEDLLAFRQRTRRERAQDERRLAQMIPDGAFRQQLEAWFNNNQALQQRFGGGIVQFAQAIAQLPPDMLEDMMLADAMGGAGGPGEGLEGVMPGGLDVLDMNEVGLVPVPVGAQRGQVEEEFDAEAEEDYDEEDEEDEEEYSPLPQAIRNIFGRLWGRQPDEEDSSEDEAPLLDTNGVD
ncbi:cytoplasmic protein [Coprinopsis sp. MPI-PUGE-AT-0042]|nr:cytoplasmic protein [Coprinopsis sp. MPI-PUGE-AT-0042]